jgi:hypothetical protein
MSQASESPRRLTFALAALVAVGALAPSRDAAAQGLQYFAVTPCRIADTRMSSFNNGAFLNGTPSMQAGPIRAFFVKGTCGIPNTAKAVSLNAAILFPTDTGFLSLWPAGGPFPVVSTINFLAGEPGLANGAIVPLNTCTSPCGDLNVVYGNDGSPGKFLDFILDVTGYFQ